MDPLLACLHRSLEAHHGRDLRLFQDPSTEGLSAYQCLSSAGHARHARALAQAVKEALFQELGLRPSVKEGLEEANWVLLDYGHVLVHILLPEARQHYALEELWKGQELPWPSKGP